ncbi:MAG: hypothetical protein Q8L22_17720, partial [Reyranella sp.]|nr:hypothetical protein [Reyranella sp.]
MGRPLPAVEPSQDPSILKERAVSCEWAARRNVFMSLVSAVAWVAITTAIVWTSMLWSQADRDERIKTSADSIRTEYVKILETIKPDLAALNLPKKADEEIASLKELTPAKISGYDLGTKLFPVVLKALKDKEYSLVPKWMDILERVQKHIGPIEAAKLELANAVGRAQQAALTVDNTPLVILLSVLAFAIFCPFMSFFGAHAQRFAELSTLYRALAE